ncbi:hypothetical protein RHMOL_Rhmol05G0203600 [Rhododendron molle]|uniref:Uncharacterized protein n=1 Tax=Rhododendron molle TaxID=49168 RepID=A0ACC0NR27_RHOML|nr:hypothetical protein RHMOL_Rhmol05G0203600 [Rhododendron molle]
MLKTLLVGYPTQAASSLLGQLGMPLGRGILFSLGTRSYGLVKDKSLRCMSLTCSLAAAVYGLWRERNCQIFLGKAMGHDQVMKGIADGVRDFLSTRRNVNQSLKNQDLCRQ